MGKIERFGHIVFLHLLPLIVYVPCGIICHWFAKDSIGFGPFDSNDYTPLFGLIGSYLGGPLVYAILTIIYYWVIVLYLLLGDIFSNVSTFICRSFITGLH